MALQRALVALCVLTCGLAFVSSLGVEDLSEEELLAPSPWATKVLTWEDVPEYVELM